MDVERLRLRLKEYGQCHLLEYWDVLDSTQQEKLFEELSNLDLDYVTQSFERCVNQVNTQGTKLDDKMQPLPSAICGSILKVRK